MPIPVKCRKCGKGYQVKDAMAGKKFRCKKCEAVVAVPTPKAAKEDDWLEDDQDDWDLDDADDLPPRPAKKKRSQKKSKQKRRKSGGSGMGAMFARIAIGLGVLFGLFICMGVFAVVAKNAGGIQNLFPSALSWQSYTTPDGAATMEMPGKAKQVKIAQIGSGGQAYGVENTQFACVVTIEPSPANIRNLSPNEIYDAVLQRPFMIPGWRNVQETTISGRRAIQFEGNRMGIKSMNRATIINGNFYTFSYAKRDTDSPDHSERFFSSVQLK